MTKFAMQKHGWGWFIVIAVIVAAGAVIMGYSTHATTAPLVEATSTPLPLVKATSTPLPYTPTILAVATSTPTPLPDRQATADAAGTQVARDYVAQRTAVALTPHPTERGGPPLETPEPVPTLALGLFEYYGTRGNDHQYPLHYTGYWNGTVNGVLLSVWAGSRSCPPIDCYIPEAMLEIFTYGPDSKMISRDTYGTPIVVGELTITKVSGSQLIVTSVSPVRTLIFDLATRQWVFVPTPIPFPPNRPTPLP